MNNRITITWLRVRYGLAQSFKEYLRQRKLKKALLEGFKARRYTKFVSTIELGNFPEGVSDVHAIAPSGEILHCDVLFPEYEEDDVAVALSSLKGRKFRSMFKSVPNPLGSTTLLQRVLTYTK